MNINEYYFYNIDNIEPKLIRDAVLDSAFERHKLFMYVYLSLICRI
jgi:hypothetical protein